jgi:DNA polymerase III epsilon subunit-like protein
MKLLVLIIIAMGILFFFYLRRKNLVPAKKYINSPRVDFDKASKNEVVIRQEKFDTDFERSDKKKGRYLVFDTETTGLPVERNARPEDYDNWPYVVQIAWYLFDDEWKLIEDKEYILKQDIKIPADATSIHGIDNNTMLKKGVDPKFVYSQFIEVLGRAKFLIAHNIAFDKPIMECELLRNGFDNKLRNVDTICTMKKGINFCKLEGYYGDYKYPKLIELFQKCFYPDAPSVSIACAIKDDSSYSESKVGIDVTMTAKCFFKLKELNIITD